MENGSKFVFKKRSSFIRFSLYEMLVLRLFWKRKPGRISISIWLFGIEIQLGPLAISFTDM